MIIEYEISIDDVVDFNLYHYTHSPSLRRTYFIGRWFFPGLLALCLIVAVEILDLHGLALGLPWLIWLIFTMFWVIFLGPRYILGQIRKRIVKMNAEGKRGGYSGKHRLSITPEGLLHSTDYGDSKTYWKSVEKILSTDRHVFIYTSATEAHIIPKRAFPDESKYHEFIDATKRYHEINVA
jgi:YcxB-like protein